MSRKILMLGTLVFLFAARGHGALSSGSANAVIGQIDYTHNGVNIAGSNGMNNPFSVAIDSVNSRVYVADTANSRVLWWIYFNIKKYKIWVLKK